tara:strand:- start:33 stop:251 length:219 start_codon:yes stop_codon:yes gene_type:complete
MSKNKEITLEDYQDIGPEFFEKYNYVKKQLGTGAKAEDVLAVMKSLGALVMKKRSDTKASPMGIGFINDNDE